MQHIHVGNGRLLSADGDSYRVVYGFRVHYGESNFGRPLRLEYLLVDATSVRSADGSFIPDGVYHLRMEDGRVVHVSNTSGHWCLVLKRKAAAGMAS